MGKIGYTKTPRFCVHFLVSTSHCFGRLGDVLFSLELINLIKQADYDGNDSGNSGNTTNEQCTN